MTDMLFKVTGTVVIDDKGRQVNLLEKTFRPLAPHCKGAEGKNADLAKVHGIYLANQYVKRGSKWSGRVAMSEGGPSISHDKGSLYDYEFDQKVRRQSIVGEIMSKRWVR